MAGGDEKTFKIIEPILQNYPSQKVHIIISEKWAGHFVKMDATML